MRILYLFYTQSLLTTIVCNQTTIEWYPMVYLLSCFIIAVYVTSWSVLFSTCEMNIAVLEVDSFQTCLVSAASAFENKGEIQRYFEEFYMCFTDLLRTTCRAVNPPHLQILRIDREGMIDDVISHGIWRHLCKKCSLTWPIVTNLWCFTLLCTLQWHNTQYRCLLLTNVRC